MRGGGEEMKFCVCPVSSATIITRSVCEYRVSDMFEDEKGYCIFHEGICVLPKYRLVKKKKYEYYEQIKAGCFKKQLPPVEVADKIRRKK